MVGRGGMARVHRATHVVDGQAVAVKLLTEASAQRASHLAAFRNEIRAVAGLDHRHIVQVYEHGQVSAEAAAGSDGLLTEGTPFLVMEYVPYSLRTRPPQSWRELSEALLAVLDGLAHAHARGVIHRDLKAGNVLCGAIDGDFRLTDFGIAHAIEGEKEVFRGGTPGYMAPEQLGSRPRSHGPWTDLYGLGTTAWMLVTGSVPYKEKDPVDAWEARMHKPLPFFLPRYPVPADFETWLRRILAPEPANRFQTAADAAWALLGLRGEQHGHATQAHLPVEEQSTELAPPRMTLIWDDESTAEWVPPLDDHIVDPIPPTPRSWRRPEAHRKRLAGAGLGLTGLRPVPLVGRVAERDALWNQLSRVRNFGRAEGVLLRGASGTGKSRLARWLAERAQELGVAQLVEVRHSPDAGPRDGLGPAVARFLRFDGAEGPKAEHWARWHLTRSHASPDLAADAVALNEGGFASQGERHAVLRRLLTELAQRRPVIVWVDDVPWAGEALEWVAELLHGGFAAPVLFVLTAADEQLVSQPIEAAMVQQLLDSDEFEELRVGPLDRDAQVKLVQRHLGLSPALASRVVTRTAGNPLFAVQLVGGWVQRGWLRPALDGFRLSEAAEEDLPADVTAAWTERLTALIDPHETELVLALEVAAALGQEVDLYEWRAVCDHLATPARQTLVEVLLSQALARRPRGSEDSIALVHGMLREAICARSREADRWTRIQLACAEALAGRGADPARVARHLQLAGHHEDAAEAFLVAMNRRMRTAEFSVVRALGREWSACLEQAGVAETDGRWGEGWLLLIRPNVYLGDFDEAERLASRIEDMGAREGWKEPFNRGPAERGYLRLRQGSFDEALTLNQLAADRCQAAGDLSGELRGLKAVAWCWSFTGRNHEAETLLREVLVRSDDAGLHAGGRAETLRLLGVCARGRGDWAESERCYREALDAADRWGLRNRVGEAECLSGIGDARRWQGDPEGARAAYREAQKVLKVVGLDAELAEFNEAVIDLENGHFDLARPSVEAIVAAWDRPETGAHAGVPLLALLPCLVHSGEWARWADTRRRALELLSEGQLVDRDVAWLAEFAARSATEAGRANDARALWMLARSQWEACGDRDHAATLPV